MPVFMSDDEYAVILSTGDVAAVADKADAFIQTLTIQADAAAISAEQTCSLLDQKYVSLSSELAVLESRNSELDSTLQRNASELAQLQSDKHQLHLKLIEKDGEIERLHTEVSELQKSRRQLVELVSVKDTEISEKNSTFKSYLDKISDMSDRAAQREARLSELEAELIRCRANCDKLTQERELIEKHNNWLNDELTSKTDTLLEQRRRNAEVEADMSVKFADMEKLYNECSSSLNRLKERIRELERKAESSHLELCSARDDASAAEQRYTAEISTLSKLVDLYKESSEQWSKKAGDLEGVIKALETHLRQVESDYKNRLEKEAAAKMEVESEFVKLKEKLTKCEAELESSRRACEMDIVPVSSLTAGTSMFSTGGSENARDSATVPHVSAGVSGTALAVSLLREGWSLAKMYTKYQEADDAFRHEQMVRKQTEAILERVLLEIEEKASVILDERAEHERMTEAYALMDQKLQQSLTEHASLEKLIRELKAEVKKREREHNYAQKEITDLQKQVTILLKECRDVQLRCGSGEQQYIDDDIAAPLTEIEDESGIQKVVSEHLLSIRDIEGLVEQNARLRSLVRSLSDDVENRDMQLKEQVEEQLQKHKEEAASRVATMLERAQEQGQMIESLHTSVSMYKRLFEEEHRLRSSQPQSTIQSPGNGRQDFMIPLEVSQENTKKMHEQACERVRFLEDELASRKSEITALRSERDKLALEANFAQEKLERFMKEFNHQREELNGVLARNIEFSQLIVDYQRKLRENTESVHIAEELSRKVNMELSVLKREKELLLNSEKRAHGEVQDLSQRVYRLQATLDAVQSTELVREEARAAERRKQEEYIKQIEREWADAKKELQDERTNVRTLSVDREHTIKDAMRQVEEISEKLATALQDVTAAEGRAAAAEAQCSNLQKDLRAAELILGAQDRESNPPSSSASEVIGNLRVANQEIERLKSEALANKNHMLQFKSIAAVNEAALKQMEVAHENFKGEAEQLKNSLEAEIQSLRDRVQDLENECSLKSEEAAGAATQKEEAVASALSEISRLKEEASNKVSQLMAVEVQVSLLKEDLDKAHQKSHAAQANYERQVILQSETIQELTKTSQALASVQDEASALRRRVDGYKSENEELVSKWVTEKSDLEKSKNEAEKKYAEINEQNKILHSQLEAMHIKLAEKDGTAAEVTNLSTSDGSQNEAGLRSVVSHLRRSREIAETEISLLKQEKLRLQYERDRAVKAVEAAESSLSMERTNSRSLLFTEDEFKALKLQVSEMNLLRESNMQLREENKHNFEECQKLHEVSWNVKVEAEKLQSILKERELEVESIRKEVELLKKDKEHLERRISDVLETSQNINLDEYNRLKSELEELQANMRQKEAQINETSKLVSQKQELIGQLEQDLASSRSELAERDRRLSLSEGLKSDLDRQKKAVANYKRRVDILVREKDSLLKEKDFLLKEKDSLLKEKEYLGNEKDSLAKDKDVLLREKEGLIKEKQTVIKQLEDLRLEKKAAADASINPTITEKEKEKDARIQILEKTVGKYREEISKLREIISKLKEDNRKEKDMRLTREKLVMAKVQSVDQERKKFGDELEKHKEVVRKLSDGLETIKHAKDSLPEGSSAVRLLSGDNYDVLESAYVIAVENFEREAHLFLNDTGNQGSVGNSLIMDATPVVTSTFQVPPAEPLVAAPIQVPAKSTEEKEKKVLTKPRKLVRPRLPKSVEPQCDVEISDADGSRNSGKPTSMHDMPIQLNVPVSAEPTLRKRPASTSQSGLQDEHLLSGDAGSDVPEPALKRSKGLEFLQDDMEAQTTGLENVETIPTVEELLDTVDAIADVPHGAADEASDFGKDIETVEGQLQDPKESQQSNYAKSSDMQTDDTVEENAGNASDSEPTLDESCDAHFEQDIQKPIIDSDREGEMPPEGLDCDVGDDAAIMGSQSSADILPDHFNTTSMSSSAHDDPLTPVVSDVKEAASAEIADANEMMEEGELTEDVTDGSDKLNSGEDHIPGDNTDESPGPRDDISSSGTGQEAEQSSHLSTTININERARQRAAARLGRTSLASASTTTRAAKRGRVGPLAHSRGGRRGGRRQGSGDQG